MGSLFNILLEIVMTFEELSKELKSGRYSDLRWEELLEEARLVLERRDAWTLTKELIQHSQLTSVTLIVKAHGFFIDSIKHAAIVGQKGIFDELVYLICKSGDKSMIESLGDYRDSLPVDGSCKDTIDLIASEHHIDLSGYGEYK